MKKITYLTISLLIIFLLTNIIVRGSFSFLFLSDLSFMTCLLFTAIAVLQLLVRSDSLRIFRAAWSKLARKEEVELSENKVSPFFFSLALSMLAISLVSLLISACM